MQPQMNADKIKNGYSVISDFHRRLSAFIGG